VYPAQAVYQLAYAKHPMVAEAGFDLVPHDWAKRQTPTCALSHSFGEMQLRWFSGQLQSRAEPMERSFRGVV